MTAPHGREVAQSVAVIEDDDSVRRSVCNLLASLGFRVTAFASAEDFLDSTMAPPACLVLDIQLPGMSGLDLLEHLRKNSLELRVVLLTAHAGEEARARAFALGAAAFLKKPFRSEDLLQAVRSTDGGGP